MTSPVPPAPEEGVVVLWRWPHNQREFFAPISGPDAPHLADAKMPIGCAEYRALPVAAYNALLARANTAKVLLKEARGWLAALLKCGTDKAAVDALLSRIDDALGEG